MSSSSRLIMTQEETHLTIPEESEHTIPLLSPTYSDRKSSKIESTFVPATLNLSKMILGAGMMVIPKSFMLVGAPIGLALLLLVSFFTWFTLSGLLKSAELIRKQSFTAVIQSATGTTGRIVCFISLFANCLGLCVVYIVVIADILVGSPPESLGIIFDFLPSLDPSAWYVGRPAIICALAGLVLAPIISQRDISFLNPLNAVGVAAVCVMTSTCVGLGVSRLWAGTQNTIPLFPDWNKLGDSPLTIALALGEIIPVLLSATVCHQSIFAAASVLKPYNRDTMNKVVVCALSLCNGLYIALALFSVLAFGDDLKSDLLVNMSVAGLEPCVGLAAAKFLAEAVRLSFLLSLLGSFAGMMHPLRQLILELLPAPPRQAGFSGTSNHPAFLPVSLLLLTTITYVAIVVPSIWDVLAVVGSAAANIMGFVLPAFVIYETEKGRTGAWAAAKRLISVVLGTLGILLFVNGFITYLI